MAWGLCGVGQGVDPAAQLKRYLDLGFDVAGVEPPQGRGVLVLPWLPFDELITRLTLPGGTATGIFDRNFEDPGRYHPVDPDVPRDRPYLVAGFEPGTEYLNVRPRDAVPAILDRGRLPVTIEEGLAAFVAHPEVLQRNACFSLAGSTRGDKRVPALWISGAAPKLGWCFAGAPHTWLGTASVAARLALS